MLEYNITRNMEMIAFMLYGNDSVYAIISIFLVILVKFQAPVISKLFSLTFCMKMI